MGFKVGSFLTDPVFMPELELLVLCLCCEIHVIAAFVFFFRFPDFLFRLSVFITPYLFGSSLFLLFFLLGLESFGSFLGLPFFFVKASSFGLQPFFSVSSPLLDSTSTLYFLLGKSFLSFFGLPLFFGMASSLGFQSSSELWLDSS